MYSNRFPQDRCRSIGRMHSNRGGNIFGKLFNRFRKFVNPVAKHGREIFRTVSPMIGDVIKKEAPGFIQAATTSLVNNNKNKTFENFANERVKRLQRDAPQFAVDTFNNAFNGPRIEEIKETKAKPLPRSKRGKGIKKKKKANTLDVSNALVKYM